MSLKLGVLYFYVGIFLKAGFILFWCGEPKLQISFEKDIKTVIKIVIKTSV
jgi:hypothetical protein